MARDTIVRRLGAALLALLFAGSSAAGAATLTIVNTDGPDEGFNDPTPAAPVGGNPGVTVGEQRLVAFQFAADLWGAVLPSDVEIFIQSSFDPLPCNASAAVLGAAGTIQIFADFPGAEIPDTWYHGALANRLAGFDLAPGPNGTDADDLVAFFNTNLGQPGCLTGIGWYYGLDNDHGGNVDLVTVLLHEFGHGLGFSNFVNEATGSRPLGMGDVFAEYTHDLTTGLGWNAMSDAERAASAINSRQVIWTGLHVTAAVPDFLAPGTPVLVVLSPASIAGTYFAGVASFGPPLAAPGVTGEVALADDGVAPATDACTPLVNGAEIAGRIALVDRGSCTFVTKVKNAQDAGAVAVLVADNVPGSPPAGLGGSDPTIVIPSARITLDDGNAIKAELAGGVTATLGLDLAVRAGADPLGRALLNAPNPVQPGSSISHWDPVAFPNLLMEPAINADLTHGLDLTLPEMADIGWFSDQDGVPDGRDACLGSDPSATVVVDGCDSGVPNVVFADGCKISDQVAACAEGAANHGAFVQCVAHLGNDLRRGGTIDGAGNGHLQSCVARAAIP